MARRKKKARKKKPGGARRSKYAAYRASQQRLMREQSELGRDIGLTTNAKGEVVKVNIPKPGNKRRRDRCAKSLPTFMRTYFPQIFKHPFSNDHKAVIATSERVARSGGMFAEALPVGSGKTSIVLVTAVWALFYGYRSFCGLVGATGPRAAKQLLGGIARQLLVNDKLLEDFPEIVYPFRCMGGIAGRAAGQLYQGKPTYIEWGTNKLVFPTVAGSKASGAVLCATGLTGDILGMIHTTAKGEIIRPDLLLIDDPQTKKSCKSDTECEYRESIINADITGRAGPDVKVSVFMTCTVKRKGDLADRMLDHELHPEWQGQRKSLVYKWADRQDLWDQYATLRKIGMAKGDDGAAATKFYKKNRARMDKGAVIAWKHRRRPGELSAIQNAYNLLIDHGSTVFASEYQNAPEDQMDLDRAPLTAKDILTKTNHLERGVVPAGYTALTLGADVRAEQIHWMVMAFGDGFSCAVIDYGVYKVRRHRDGMEAARFTGLSDLVPALLTREYEGETAGTYRVSRGGLDSGFKAREVYRFWRTSPQRALFLPTKGYGYKAYKVPAKIARRDFGEGWYVKLTPEKDAALCHISVDEWKSHLDERLRTAPGGMGCMEIFGLEPATDTMPQRQANHRELADHFTAERPYKDTTRHGDEYVRWDQTPAPNHFWDCAVICSAMASVEGVKLEGVAPKPKGVRKKRRARPGSTSRRGTAQRRSRY